jgi:hypothetical protein
MCASGQVKYLMVSENVGQTLLLMITFTDLYKKEFEDICFYDMTSQYNKYTRVTNQNSFIYTNSVTVIQDISSVIYPN